MYKGQLSGFPQEVVEKMLEKQEEQGNKRDVKVFESNSHYGKIYGGFDWDKTIEKDDFWSDVIDFKNFDLFFKRYPKDPIPENWYMVITEENLEIAKKWQKEKSGGRFSNLIKKGELLLSYHYDNSYYFAGGLTSFKQSNYFKNKNYKEITTEQFKKYILKEEVSMETPKSQKISREKFAAIHRVACSEWKKKLESWALEQGMFAPEYTLTQYQVNEMFDAATTKQKPVLEEAGLTQSFELDLTKSFIKIKGDITCRNPLTECCDRDTLISVRSSVNSKYHQKSFFLSPHFEWTIEKDGKDSVLVVKHK